MSICTAMPYKQRWVKADVPRVNVVDGRSIPRRGVGGRTAQLLSRREMVHSDWRDWEWIDGSKRPDIPGSRPGTPGSRLDMISRTLW